MQKNNKQYQTIMYVSVYIALYSIVLGAFLEYSINKMDENIKNQENERKKEKTKCQKTNFRTLFTPLLWLLSWYTAW